MFHWESFERIKTGYVRMMLSILTSLFLFMFISHSDEQGHHRSMRVGVEISDSRPPCS